MNNQNRQEEIRNKNKKALGVDDIWTIVVVFVVIFFELLSARSDISAGNKNGTYIQIAREIASIVAKDIVLIWEL